MPIEVVQLVEAPVTDVINACRSVANDLRWRVLIDDGQNGKLTFKTRFWSSGFWSHHIDISVQKNNSGSLITVWAEAGAIDVTREGARTARTFTRAVLDEIERSA